MNSNQIFAASMKKSEPVLRALSSAGLTASQVLVTPDGALHVSIAYPENDLTPQSRRELNEVRRYEYITGRALTPADPEWDTEDMGPAGMQYWTFTVEAGDTYGRAVTRARADFERYPYSPLLAERIGVFYKALRGELTGAHQSAARRQTAKRGRQTV